MASQTSKFKLVDEYTPQKLPFKMDISMLNYFIGYLFKKSRQITRKSLSNMRKLFDIMDERQYESNPKMAARIEFIKRGLTARLDNGFENEGMILNFCRTDTENEENEEIIQNIERYSKINYEEIVHINNVVQDRLKYAFMLMYSPKLYELAERLDSGDFDSYKQINDEYTKLCRTLLNETRKINVLEDFDTFSLDDVGVDDNLTDIINRLKDPARILKVGIKKLNQILAPGFHSKRLYMFMGLPGGFKSGILLKVARDIKKYNKDVPTKKPGKRKTVVLITMENTVNYLPVLF